MSLKLSARLDMKHFLLWAWLGDAKDHGTTHVVGLSKLSFTKLCLTLKDRVRQLVSMGQMVKMLNHQNCH